MNADTPTPARVLLVEDEEDFREPVARYLRRAGMAVLGIGTATELDAALSQFEPEVMVLDVNLPGEDGFAISERVRRHSTVGILMLSARGSQEDRLHGLRVGADFYLVKPVPPAELAAVVWNLLRRVRETAAATAERSPSHDAPASNIEEIAAPASGWQLLAAQWLLIAPNGASCPLSAVERDLLAVLMTQAGTPVGREALLRATGKHALGPMDRRIDIALSRLRGKLADFAELLPVKAVRGRGYVFYGEVCSESAIAKQSLQDRDAQG